MLELRDIEKSNISLFAMYKRKIIQDWAQLDKKGDPLGIVPEIKTW